MSEISMKNETKSGGISRRAFLKGVGYVVGVAALGTGGYKGLEYFLNSRTPKEISPNFSNQPDAGVLSATNWLIINDVKDIESIPIIPEGDNLQHNINILTPLQNPPNDLTYSKSLFSYFSSNETNYLKNKALRIL